MKQIKTLLASAAISLGTASSMNADTATVTISDLTWTGAEAIAHVIKAVIDGPLNSEAVIVEGLSDGSVVAAGMDKGDGSADVYTDLWMPNRQGIWDQCVDGAQSLGNSEPYLGTQMMNVPSYMADRVRTVDDLDDPEVASMFDQDGNGKDEY